EYRAVSEGAEHSVRHLHRQARLAAPADAGERHQPVLGDELGHVRDLRLSPNQRRSLRRERSTGGPHPSGGGELLRQCGIAELEKVLRVAKILEPMVPEAGEGKVSGQLATDEVGGRRGDEDLAAVGSVADALCEMDLIADVIAVAKESPTRV